MSISDAITTFEQSIIAYECMPSRPQYTDLLNQKERLEKCIAIEPKYIAHFEALASRVFPLHPTAAPQPVREVAAAAFGHRPVEFIVEGSVSQNDMMRDFRELTGQEMGSPCYFCARRFLEDKDGAQWTVRTPPGFIDKMVRLGSEACIEAGIADRGGFAAEGATFLSHPLTQAPVLIGTEAFADVLVESILIEGRTNGGPVRLLLTNQFKTYAILSQSGDHFEFFDSHGGTLAGIAKACAIEFSSQDAFRNFLRTAPIFQCDPELVDQLGSVDVEFLPLTGAVAALPPPPAVPALPPLLPPPALPRRLAVAPAPTPLEKLFITISETASGGGLSQEAIDNLNGIIVGLIDSEFIYNNEVHELFHHFNVSHSVGFKEFLFGGAEGYNEAVRGSGFGPVETATHSGVVHLNPALFTEHFERALATFRGRI
jgi:hypothetical protein